MVESSLRKLLDLSLVVLAVVLASYIHRLLLAFPPNILNSTSIIADSSLTFPKLTAGFYLQSPFLLQPLILALAYLSSQENPNGRMTFFIVQIRTKYLPYCMLAMTFVMAGPSEALTQSTGLLAAHTYNFLTRIWPQYGGGRNYIRTPEIVRRWFATPNSGVRTRAYGTAFQGRTAGQGTTGSARAGGEGGSGWTSGFSSSVWGSRGTGRRLGGD